MEGGGGWEGRLLSSGGGNGSGGEAREGRSVTEWGREDYWEGMGGLLGGEDGE